MKKCNVKNQMHQDFMFLQMSYEQRTPELYRRAAFKMIGENNYVEKETFDTIFYLLKDVLGDFIDVSPVLDEYGQRNELQISIRYYPSIGLIEGWEPPQYSFRMEAVITYKCWSPSRNTKEELAEIINKARGYLADTMHAPGCYKVVIGAL